MGTSTVDLAAQSLGDDVYWNLRSEIVRGILRPNQALAETEIAERLEVSRTPVRESLQRLAADGLVELRRRRWVVHEHTPAEIRDIYEVRAALEGFAARLASERITDDQRKVLSSVVDTTGELKNPSQRVRANEEFHDRIVAIADNKRLADLLIRNRHYYFNLQVASLYSPDELAVSAGQHAQVVKAVCDRDGQAAEEVARSHVLSALAIIMSRLD